MNGNFYSNPTFPGNDIVNNSIPDTFIPIADEPMEQSYIEIYHASFLLITNAKSSSQSAWPFPARIAPQHSFPLSGWLNFSA